MEYRPQLAVAHLEVAAMGVGFLTCAGGIGGPDLLSPGRTVVLSLCEKLDKFAILSHPAPALFLAYLMRISR